MISPEKPKYVYAIQHKPTGRIYVGSSQNVQDRIYTHIRDLKRGAHPVELMQEDADKYGCDYEFFILDKYESCFDSAVEYKWMEKLNTGDPECGYNYKDAHFRNRRKPLPISEGIPISNKDKDNE